MKYSFYKKYIILFIDIFFIFYFAKILNILGKKVSIISPDIIEGEQYISLEDNVSIASSCWLLAHKQDMINPNLYISKGVIIGRIFNIVALRSVIIKENVLIADKVWQTDNIHSYEKINIPIMKQEILYKSEAVIGKNSWIG